RRQGGLDEVDLYLSRRVVHPEHRILVEVRLRGSAPLDRNLLKPRSADAIEHRSLYLGFRRAEVDDHARIYGRGELLDRQTAVATDGDIGNDGDVGAIGSRDRESLPLASRALLSPARLLGREIEHLQHSLRVESLTGNTFEQVLRECDRLAARGMRELVDETLRGPDVPVVTRCAPKAGGNAGRQLARVHR